MQTIVVTRHPALVDHLRDLGFLGLDTEVITHATAEQIRGKHVVGVLPLHLAAEAASVTEVPMDLPPEARGRELTLGEVRQYCRPPVTYVVFAPRPAADLVEALNIRAGQDGCHLCLTTGELGFPPSLESGGYGPEEGYPESRRDLGLLDHPYTRQDRAPAIATAEGKP